MKLSANIAGSTTFSNKRKALDAFILLIAKLVEQLASKFILSSSLSFFRQLIFFPVVSFPDL